jgi:effector-binding domain-containing protein
MGQTPQWASQVFKVKGNPMYAIETRDIDDATVLSVSGRVRLPELPEFIPESSSRLFGQLDAQGAKPSGPLMVLYHEKPEADAEALVEVIVPFDGRIEPTNDFTVRVEPKHREAYTRITKGEVMSPKIMDAYGAVMAWLDESGVTATAAPREVYFDPRPWPELRDDEPATDIAFPFTG